MGIVRAIASFFQELPVIPPCGWGLVRGESPAAFLSMGRGFFTKEAWRSGGVVDKSFRKLVLCLVLFLCHHYPKGNSNAVHYRNSHWLWGID